MKQGHWTRIAWVGCLTLAFHFGAQAGTLGEIRELATRTGLGGIATMDSAPRPEPGPDGDAAQVFYNFNIRIDKRGPEKGGEKGGAEKNAPAAFAVPADFPQAGTRGTGIVCQWIGPLVSSRIVQVAFRCH